MRPPLLYSRALWLTVFTLLVQPTVLSAQNDDPDTKTYNSYVLSIPKYKKYLAAMVGIAKASERSPAAARSFEDLGELSIDQSVARLNKVPEIRGARQGMKDRAGGRLTAAGQLPIDVAALRGKGGPAALAEAGYPRSECPHMDRSLTPKHLTRQIG